MAPQHDREKTKAPSRLEDGDLDVHSVAYRLKGVYPKITRSFLEEQARFGELSAVLNHINTLSQRGVVFVDLYLTFDTTLHELERREITVESKRGAYFHLSWFKMIEVDLTVLKTKTGVKVKAKLSQK